MIAKLEIRNFQKWERLSIEFGEGITTIVGPTDIGKSAVLRALRWVCLNKPSASEIQNDDAGFVWVRLYVGKHVIERRSGKKNLYKLNGRNFVSFKTGVPDEIANLLKIADFHFQDQHDPAFGLTLSPGEFSKTLNRIVNLDLIDNVLAKSGSDLRKAKTVAEVTTTRLRKLREEKKNLAYVPDMVAAYSRISRKQTTLAENNQKHSKLHVLLEQVRQVKDEQRTAGGIATACQEIVSKYEKRRELVSRARTVEILLTNIDEVKTVLEKGTLVHWASHWDEWQQQITNGRHELTNLDRILEQIEQVTKERDESIDAANEAHKQLDKELKGRCPICQTKMKS